jgi:hypothetical protein
MFLFRSRITQYTTIHNSETADFPPAGHISVTNQLKNLILVYRPAVITIHMYRSAVKCKRLNSSRLGRTAAVFVLEYAMVLNLYQLLRQYWLQIKEGLLVVK